MLEALTGVGLAASAGLNAWIPLLVIGLLNRYTSLITLPHGWAWLSNGWVLVILGILLAIEVIADKVPILDSVNDVVHTVIRPTAGGIAFGASSESQTVTVTDPGTFFHSHQWIPIATGAFIALCLHSVKASVRPVANTVTVGTAAPVLSTLEDVVSTGLSLIAIVLPILVIVVLALILFGAWRIRKRIKRRRAEKRAAKAAARAAAAGPGVRGLGAASGRRGRGRASRALPEPGAGLAGPAAGPDRTLAEPGAGGAGGAPGAAGPAGPGRTLTGPGGGVTGWVPGAAGPAGLDRTLAEPGAGDGTTVRLPADGGTAEGGAVNGDGPGGGGSAEGGPRNAGRWGNRRGRP